ncbi:RNA polymerase-binding transcription factor [compost metagenome]
MDAALNRIEAGTYGECTDCGTDITAARLHATPEAPRCVHCQEKAELQQRHAA